MVMGRVVLGLAVAWVVLSAVLAGGPAASADSDGRAGGEAVSGVAPVWPFAGVVDDSGTFVGLPDGRVFRLGLQAAGCLMLNGGSDLGYSDEYVFFGRLRHAAQTSPWLAGSFVAPWGDAAYPLLTSPIQSWRLLRGSDYPLTMDRFSTEDVSSPGGTPSDPVRPRGADVKPLVSLGFVPAGQYYSGSEVLRFKSGVGEQHYLLNNGPDALLEIDGAEADLLLRDPEDVPSADGDSLIWEESEEGTGASPTHTLRLDRVSDEYVVWSMGRLLWNGFCTWPHTVIQDVRTGSAVSCTSSVLMRVAMDSSLELAGVPPLRGLDDCTARPWESVLGTLSAAHDTNDSSTGEES